MSCNKRYPRHDIIFFVSNQFLTWFHSFQKTMGIRGDKAGEGDTLVLPENLNLKRHEKGIFCCPNEISLDPRKKTHSSLPFWRIGTWRTSHRIWCPKRSALLRQTYIHRRTPQVYHVRDRAILAWNSFTFGNSSEGGKKSILWNHLMMIVGVMMSPHLLFFSSCHTWEEKQSFFPLFACFIWQSPSSWW